MIENSLPMAGYNGIKQSRHVADLISGIDWNSEAGEELWEITVQGTGAVTAVKKEKLRNEFMRKLELTEGK